MPQAENHVFEERPNPNVTAAESMLLGCGSVHNDQGDSKTHDGVLVLEVDVVTSNSPSPQEHSTNETEGQPSRLLQEGTQRPASAATDMNCLGLGEALSELIKLPAEATVGGSKNMQKEGREEIYPGTKNKSEEDNWSIVVERSQKDE